MFYRHFTSELWKLFGKKRTYIGFGAFLVVQNATLLFFRFTRWQQDLARNLQGNGYLVSEYISALTVALIMLLPQVILLMPLYAALVGGDLVAKEAEDGTLRMILARPISRFQLLLAKWLAGVTFSIVLVAGLGAMAVLFARIWFPWRAMFVFWPPLGIFSLMDASDGLRLYIFSHAFMAINASAVLSVAFMFSCFNMKPAAATILSLSFLFMNIVLENLPFFDRYEEYLLPYHFRIWLFIYSSPTPWARIGQSLCVLLAFNLTTFIIGTAAFQTRDIKS
jgi:ABC-2 type transport system permease protein